MFHLRLFLSWRYPISMITYPTARQKKKAGLSATLKRKEIKREGKISTEEDRAQAGFLNTHTQKKKRRKKLTGLLTRRQDR